MAQLSPSLNPQGWSTQPVTVTLSATDALSGVDHTEASLDGGAWATLSGSISVSSDGVHMLQYRSVDRAGNAEATQTATLRIDQTAPLLTITPTAGPLQTDVPLATVLSSASFRNTGGQSVGTTAVSCYTTRGLSLGLSATDPAGSSGVASLNYGASAAQPMPSTTTSGGSVTLPFSAMSLTVLSATATDHVGNGSTAQQETVLVDSTHSQPLACAAQTMGFTVPPYGSVRLAGTLTVNGLTIPFTRTIRY